MSDKKTSSVPRLNFKGYARLKKGLFVEFDHMGQLQDGKIYYIKGLNNGGVNVEGFDETEFPMVVFRELTPVEIAKIRMEKEIKCQ